MRRIFDLLDARRLPDLPSRWLHGDGHLGNVMVGSDGTTWGDWEECWFGPIAWDLACLSHRKTVFGEISDATDAASAAYGEFDQDVVDAYMPLVALWTAAWGTAVSPGGRTQRRIDRVAQRV